MEPSRGFRRNREWIRRLPVGQRVLVQPEAGYPSLREHLATRRRFLEVMGASLATASGLLLGCQGTLGAGNDEDAGEGGPDTSTPLPDAARPPDATARPPGSEQWPGYHTLRIPLDDDLTVQMLDRYSAIFHVDVATSDVDTYQTLVEHPLAARDACLDIVQKQTYEALNTPLGMAAAEDLLLEALDALVMTLDHHDRPTIELVALHISAFEEPVVNPGEMRKPSYP